MNVRTLVCCAVACLCSTSHAQEANPHIGTWKAEFTTKNGVSREGKVVISDKAGTWDMAIQIRNNPCAGKVYPITVLTASASELSFEINRAKTLTGCSDGLAKLRVIDDRTLEGQVDETKLKLIRQ